MMFSNVFTAKVINSGYSHISEPALELHSRAGPSVGGNITAPLVQPRGEILEEGRKKTKKTLVVSNLQTLVTFERQASLSNATANV